MLDADRRLPKYRTLMKDTARDVFGEFMAKDRNTVYLRPVGGGREWSVSSEHVRQATYAEKKRVLGSSFQRPAGEAK
jgi:hypothetical protein